MTIYCRDQARPVKDACETDCGCNYMRAGACAYCGTPYPVASQVSRAPDQDATLHGDKTHERRNREGNKAAVGEGDEGHEVARGLAVHASGTESGAHSDSGGRQVTGTNRRGSPPAAQPQEPGTWQPIETAPKVDEWEIPRTLVCVWSKQHGVSLGRAWRWPDGATAANRESYGDSTITHWMPLPAAASEQRGGSEE